MSESKRFELPPGLAPGEERALIAALERYLSEDAPGPDPWVFAGRLDATGMGALQTRRAGGAWRRATRSAFVRRGVPPFLGRGDAK
jgi:hypothetical protein